jgi:hypothetical protein
MMEATIMGVLIIIVQGEEAPVELPYHAAMEVARRMGLHNGHKELLKQWLEAVEPHIPAPIRLMPVLLPGILKDAGTVSR